MIQHLWRCQDKPLCSFLAVCNFKKQILYYCLCTNWIGNVLRGDGLLRDVLEGRMLGKRPRGRPRGGMRDDLVEGSFVKVKRRAEGRKEWREWVPGIHLCQGMADLIWIQIHCFLFLILFTVYFIRQH